MLPEVLNFEDTVLDVIDRNGDAWLRGWQIASALGYKNPSVDISKLYSRNADEFTDDMTATIRLQTAGGLQDVRIFSLRGAHLLGMLARTDRAKAFRRWVLDVLDGIATVPNDSLMQPPPIPSSVAHRADHIIAATRSFNGLMRTANALRIDRARAARTANAATFRHTGIDLLEELCITDADFDDDTDPLVTALWQFVQQQTEPFSMAEVAEHLNISPAKLTPTITGRIGTVLRKLGCGRKENRHAADPGRRRLYLPPSMYDQEAAPFEEFANA